MNIKVEKYLLFINYSYLANKKNRKISYDFFVCELVRVKEFIYISTVYLILNDIL